MIHKLISKGESKTVEFKENFPKNNQIAKTICSFANRAGGVILIGVKDDGSIKGFDNLKASEYIEKIPNIIYDTIYPMIVPEIYTYHICNMNLIVIQVYPGNSTPYYIKEKGKYKGTYVRVGRTNKLADEELLKELERKRINKSFDEDILNIEKILKDVFNQEIFREKLLNLHMIEKIGDIEYMTNAAAIVQGILKNATIKCARFVGDTVVDFIDKKEHEGDIFTVFENTVAFLKNHINIAGIIRGNGLKRKDIYEIPEEVIREGIINAIIHRDYSITGADIKVAVFDSKIEITSPGGFPKTITVEEIYAGRSEVRNRILSYLLLKCGYVEQWGSGIPRIRALCREHGLVEPEIAEKGFFVILTIYRKSQKVKTESNKYKIIKKTKNEQIQEEKERIYQLLSKDKYLTVSDIAFTLMITEASTQRRLESLQENKKIRRVGSKKTGYWEILL